MSAAESEGVQDIERVATVTSLPSRVVPELAPLTIPTRAQIADLVTPPDIWSDDRPSLRKIWLYGVYGRWTDARGPFRVAGAIYATLAGAAHAVAYLALWIVERPARFFIAATVAALIKLAF